MVSEFDLENSTMRRSRPTGGLLIMKKKISTQKYREDIETPRCKTPNGGTATSWRAEASITWGLEASITCGSKRNCEP